MANLEIVKWSLWSKTHKFAHWRTYGCPILVFPIDEESHKNQVSYVLEVFKENNMSINSKKSNFFTKIFKYLGKIITKTGVQDEIGGIKKINLEQEQGNIAKDSQAAKLVSPFYKNLSTKLTNIYYLPKRKKTVFKPISIVKPLRISLKKKTIRICSLSCQRSLLLETDASDLGLRP